MKKRSHEVWINEARKANPCATWSPATCSSLAGADQALPGPERSMAKPGTLRGDAGQHGRTQPSLRVQIADGKWIETTNEETADELLFKWADVEPDYWDTIVLRIRVATRFCLGVRCVGVTWNPDWSFDSYAVN